MVVIEYMVMVVIDYLFTKCDVDVDYKEHAYIVCACIDIHRLTQGRIWLLLLVSLVDFVARNGKRRLGNLALGG